ncbi:hypothetical protein MK805_05595 [Shimazuella sp. AN120528]|uniref:hypothetical protein n=1 Tax=Shimazuella soli TaxID=1892854 RepID=UPI001F0F86FF|nr:hypothetical protein [Shimazuella soli]MCH5584440.1 hypothetical protein [Shimazuella soli]
MLNVQDISRTKPHASDLTLYIEGEDGFESGFIHLQNVTFFRSPSGISIIFSYED